MTKLHKDLSGNWNNVKLAPFYKIWWCALLHIKTYKSYAVWDFSSQNIRDIQIYGCMKCNIWRRVDGSEE